METNMMSTVNPIRGEKHASPMRRNPLVELLLEEPKLNMRLGKKWREGAEDLGELESTIAAALVPDTLKKGFGYGVPTAEVAKRCTETLKCEVDEGVMIFDIQAILEPLGWVAYEDGKAFLLPAECREEDALEPAGDD
jgi:hypothetical protein